MDVTKVFPGCYHASYKGVSVIGVSFGDAIMACMQAYKEEHQNANSN